MLDREAATARTPEPQGEWGADGAAAALNFPLERAEKLLIRNKIEDFAHFCTQKGKIFTEISLEIFAKIGYTII